MLIATFFLNHIYFSLRQRILIFSGCRKTSGSNEYLWHMSYGEIRQLFQRPNILYMLITGFKLPIGKKICGSAVAVPINLTCKRVLLRIIKSFRLSMVVCIVRHYVKRSMLRTPLYRTLSREN